jgi:hypothetical protein
MMTLPDEKIVQITKDVAEANNIPALDVSTAAAIDSSGLPAIEVTISIIPGASFAFFEDGRSTRTVSQVVQRLADEGEERLPVVHFEGSCAP